MFSKTCSHITAFACLSSPFTSCHIKNLVLDLPTTTCICPRMLTWGPTWCRELQHRYSHSYMCSGQDLTSDWKIQCEQPYLRICYAKHRYVCFLLSNSIHDHESPELLKTNVQCIFLCCTETHWTFQDSSNAWTFVGHIHVFLQKQQIWSMWWPGRSSCDIYLLHLFFDTQRTIMKAVHCSWKITLPSLANVLNFTSVSSLTMLYGCTCWRRYSTYICKVRAKTCQDSKIH